MVLTVTKGHKRQLLLGTSLTNYQLLLRKGERTPPKSICLTNGNSCTYIVSIKYEVLQKDADIKLHCNGKKKPDKKTKPQNKLSRRFLPFFPLQDKQCQVESSDSFKDNLKSKFVKQRMQQAAPPS